ncbi:hypothetical protein GOP47_0004260 [Adiantum capillus-veneris]|uniref:Uncharacterized protein n=1 Tax=Adiantum capillus-veneris TaxID=13818 RepID=A0A9D4V7T0_ADICA|nr:hypothetical protein GOP47_0004260 [Adiantum capillus-veneris]
MIISLGEHAAEVTWISICIFEILTIRDPFHSCKLAIVGTESPGKSDAVLHRSTTFCLFICDVTASVFFPSFQLSLNF